MIDGNSFGLAGGSRREKQITEIARHLVDWFRFPRGEGDPIVYRPALASRRKGEFSGLSFFFSVQKQVDAGIADNSQISVDGGFRIQWNITGSAAPNSQKRGVGVDGVFRE